MQQQGRQYPKHHIELLSQQRNDLKLQLQALEEQQQSLKVQHAVAASCCDILLSIRARSVHKGWDFARGGILPDELPLLLDMGFQVDLSQQPAADLQQIATKHQQHQQQQQESTRMTRSKAAAAAPPKIRLQQHMPGSSSSPVFCWDSVSGPSTAAAGPAQPFAGQQRPVLVPGELMGPMKYALSQPPYPGAATFSLSDASEYYTHFVKELAFILSRFDTAKGGVGDASAADQQQLLLKLRELQLNHTRVVFSLLLLHQEGLLTKLHIFNHETKELSDTPEQSLKRMCWLAEKLELSRDQEVALIAGGEFFKRLADKVRAERAEHLAQQQAQANERLPTGRAVDLEGQQQMAERLQVLVRKELLLQTMASAFAGSVLDVRQCAQAAVLAWPLGPHMGTFVGILMKQQAEKKQQQQQQHKQPWQNFTWDRTAKSAGSSNMPTVAGAAAAVGGGAAAAADTAAAGMRTAFAAMNQVG